MPEVAGGWWDPSKEPLVRKTDEHWEDVWKRMNYEGWNRYERKDQDGNDAGLSYTKPGGKREGQGGKEGIDFFTTKEEVKGYLKQLYPWWEDPHAPIRKVDAARMLDAEFQQQEHTQETEEDLPAMLNPSLGLGDTASRYMRSGASFEDMATLLEDMAKSITGIDSKEVWHKTPYPSPNTVRLWKKLNEERVGDDAPFTWLGVRWDEWPGSISFCRETGEKMDTCQSCQASGDRGAWVATPNSCDCKIWIVRHRVSDSGTKMMKTLVKERASVLRTYFTEGACLIIARSMAMQKGWTKLKGHFHRRHLEERPILSLQRAHGGLIAGWDGNGILHPLTPSWLQTAECKGVMLEPALVDEVLKSNSKIKVPNGAAVHVSSLKLNFSVPQVRLAHVQPPNSYSCYGMAAASVISLLGETTGQAGLQSAALRIAKAAPKIHKNKNRRTSDLIRKSIAPHGYEMGPAPADFDPSKKDRSGKPFIVGLRSKGAYPHVIACYNGVIIDPAEERALSRDIANLQAICGGRNSYRGYQWAMVLQPKLRNHLSKAEEGEEEPDKGPRRASKPNRMYGILKDFEEIDDDPRIAMIATLCSILDSADLYDVGNKIWVAALKMREEDWRYLPTRDKNAKEWARNTTRRFLEMQYKKTFHVKVQREYDWKNKDPSDIAVLCELRGKPRTYVGFGPGEVMVAPQHKYQLRRSQLPKLRYTSGRRYNGMHWCLVIHKANKVS